MNQETDTKVDPDAVQYVEEAVPEELWFLRARDSGHWIRSSDDECSLVCQTSQADAEAAAKYTSDNWGIPCDPVCVIPAGAVKDHGRLNKLAEVSE